MRTKDNIRSFFNLWRLWLVSLTFRTAKAKKEISMDITAWNNVKQLSCKEKKQLHFFMLDYKEFRNVFIYRIQNKFLKKIIKLFFPPLDSLYIACPSIGGGLFIQHGFSTIIACQSIGENCWINQQVTIGWKGTESPIIGNNVKIFCSAIVIGGIKLDDDVTVGAGAVVVKDVPTGTTVVGNPAKPIKRN